MAMDLSFIISVYNVEKYIRTCIESIYQQDLDENSFEVIIVNDGTKDRSMEMIADLIEQHSNIIVINQENQGLSVARNNGIIKAMGEYIAMIDSDDLILKNSMKPLLEKALSSKADLMIADFIELTNEEISTLNHNYPIQKKEITTTEIRGIDILDTTTCKYCWRYLYKREFLLNNHILFEPCLTYAEDVPFITKCLVKARMCQKTTCLLNIYRKGNYSASSILNIQKLNLTQL